MTYDLYIGDRTFSSWSLRGWLMFKAFNIPCNTHLLGLYAGTMPAEMRGLAPAKTVPTIKTPSGVIVSESMAIAETLAEENPDAGLWPKDSAARANARWLCAEMAASFGALRGECAMQLEYVFTDFEVSDAVKADLDRIETLWDAARSAHGADSPWLMGDYSAVEAFYTPVAARIIGYDLPVSDAAKAYCMAMLSTDLVREWRAEGLKTRYDPFPYGKGLTRADWPV
jgi:glutathione S-transferase